MKVEAISGKKLPEIQPEPGAARSIREAMRKYGIK